MCWQPNAYTYDKLGSLLSFVKNIVRLKRRTAGYLYVMHMLADHLRQTKSPFHKQLVDTIWNLFVLGTGRRYV